MFVKNDKFLHAVCQTGRREAHFPPVLLQTASNSNKQFQTVSGRQMCSRFLTFAKHLQTVSDSLKQKQFQTVPNSLRQSQTSQAVSSSSKHSQTGGCFHVFWFSKTVCNSLKQSQAASSSLKQFQAASSCFKQATVFTSSGFWEQRQTVSSSSKQQQTVSNSLKLSPAVSNNFKQPQTGTRSHVFWLPKTVSNSFE